MGRKIRRVPVGFDWPLERTWSGFLMPENLHGDKCPDCTNGYSAHGQHLHDLWYGYAPFDPASTGSTPYRRDTPAVRAFAERNVKHAPLFYGWSEHAIVREATRLADLFNSQWSHHLSQDDVDALIAADRLWDLTRTCTREDGWQKIEPLVTPTAEQVNEWSIRGFGHDGINASVAISARCEREGAEVTCPTCNGHAWVEAYPGQRAEAEAWEKTDPPLGDGWQLWETVSEGSPISPVFGTAERLARWMTRNDCTVDGPFASVEAAMRFIREGWAPSFISTPETGVVNGATYAGMAEEVMPGKP